MATDAPNSEDIYALINAKGELSLRVVPGARVERVAIENGSLKIWLRTAPEDGKANKAVLAILAKLTGLSVSQLVKLGGRQRPPPAHHRSPSPRGCHARPGSLPDQASLELS